MFFSFDLNGETRVVDAPSKSAAKSYAAQLVNIEVRPASKEELKVVGIENVPSVVRGGKTEEQAAEAEAKKAERAAKKAQPQA